MEQIDKDVKRTLPDFSFFQLPVSSPKLAPLTTQEDRMSGINDRVNDRINDRMNDRINDRINGARSLSFTENYSSSNDDDTISNYSDSSNNSYSELETSIESSFPTPLTPLTPTANSAISTRRAIFRRLQHLNKNFGAMRHMRHSSSGSSCKSPTTTRENEEVDLHWEAIERILFIYAKLNPGVGYVQGMNEILGPIYYTMANDSDEEGKGNNSNSNDVY